MGEVAVSCEDLGGKRLGVEAEKAEERCGVAKQSEESSGWVFMREKLLNRRTLRVLLVEADDSTRQVIAALLRKCSYKVAAVSDGLKAWDVLKGRSNNIDLILTEVDLSAISGFALLTLIMEHEMCKNIPVIMMSSRDSISRVYKCMMKGAADYLVKPIRRNELTNLWQHVWRKQTSMSCLNGPHNESLAQQKVEATCDNDTATDDHSNGDAASIQRNMELTEKGRDALSSFTKPDMEAECTPIEDLKEHAQSKYDKAYPNVEKVNENEPGFDLGNSKNGDTAATLGRDLDPVYHKARASNFSEGRDNNNALVSSASREATHFTFHNYPTFDQTSNIAPSPKLDLSLGRSESHSFENEVIEERNNTLVHSDSSAFKRYNSRQMQTLPMAEKQQIGCGTESDKNTCDMVTCCNSESSTPSLERSCSLATVHSKETLAASQLQQRVFTTAVKGYSEISPVFYTKSDVPLPLCLSSVAHREPSFPASMFPHLNIEDHNSPNLCKPHGENTKNGNELTMHRQDQGMEPSENQGGQVSPPTDQSASSSFCNGAFSRSNSVAYGRNCGSHNNADQNPALMAGPESKSEDLTKYGISNRAVQREAALTKFRLKRKERCYEKKIRYESRKKLADKRPRVKGQFVRQPDELHPTTEKNAY